MSHRIVAWLLVLGSILAMFSGCVNTTPDFETLKETDAPVTDNPVATESTTASEYSEPTVLPTEPSEDSATEWPLPSDSTEEPTTLPPTESTSTEPPATETTEPTETEPTETVPTETEPPATEPSTEPTDSIGEEYIGSLYTRTELEAMDSKNQGYGPGSARDEKNRPYGAMQLSEKYEKYDAWFIGPDDGNIYLTFDLGWENGGLTNQMLDVMKEKNVKAVFFVLHEYCVANPEIIRRIIDEGHIIGSHAYRHKTLANMSVDKIAEEIWRLHEYMLEEFGYEMTLFRPPSGEFSEQVLAIAQSLGYRTVNWSYAYVDWLADDQPDVQKSFNKLMNAAHSGCIYLLHTVSTTNAALLGDLIDGLRVEGYNFALFTDKVEK
ncbi:MAG: polysaccharide deacetylase family protein [Oscillospiraceae bacterium]|nr:polysaccharide deacetylase family protein [Oscillospiraceae bacterium]